MQEARNTRPLDAAPRSVWPAILRGFALRCPACGRGRLFRAYLKVVDRCPRCASELFHHRTDDAPPYFTMLIVGHVVLGGVLAVERAYAPPILAHMLLWLPLTLAVTLLLLPRVKGALVGLQWALRMHGFAATTDGAGPAAAGLARADGAGHD